MPFPTELAGIAGALELSDWFGRWPLFHDAEVLSLHLDRTGSSVLAVRAWGMTNKTSCEDFHHQNVWFDLRLTKQDGGFNLTLDSSFGLSGSILAKNVA